MPRALSRRTWWCVALLQVVLLLVTMALPAAAAVPDPTTMSGTQLVQLLQSYGIVKGDNFGNLNLDKPITRAEMVTILVRALNGEKEAQSYVGMGLYQDAKGHWAEGNIAYATAKNLIKGDGNGNVRPNDPVSYAEALTMIVRLVGKEPTTGTWPVNIILAASDLKIIPDGIFAGNIRESAVRGLVFQSLAKAVMTVTTPSGKTFLQTYVDTVPPTVTLDPVDAKTTAGSIKVKGTARDAVAVTVNGKVTETYSGSFTADVALAYGSNKITVVALDAAGNEATSEVSVNRVPPVASLEITGPDKVRPNGTAVYVASAKDETGKAVALTGVTATVTGNIGTFDLTTGNFKASQTPGKGTITLTAGSVTKSIAVEVMGQNTAASRLRIRTINNGLAVAYTKPMTVQVEVQDNTGSFLDTDYGRPVSLTVSGGTGVTVTPAVAYTEAGVATFTVTTTAMATIALNTSSASLTADATVATFGSNLHVHLIADPGTVLVGGTTTMARIRAELRDENNNLVGNNTSGDILVNLQAENTDGYLADTTVVIPRGAVSSSQIGDEGMFRAGINAGTATIRGTVSGNSNMTVDPVGVNVAVPVVGAGTKLDVFGPVSYLSVGAEATFVVRLVDANGNIVPSNSYAFQLQVDTSNGEPKTNGIPAGVTIQLGTTGLNPVSDGIAEGAANDTGDVIARTAGGIAVVKVTYNKPGKVTLTPVPVGTYANAYSSDGILAVANNTVGFGVAANSAVYQAPVKGISLTATTDALGSNQPAAAIGNSPANAVTLTATLTDDQGRWVPATTANVTLERVSGTSTTLPTNVIVGANDGKATFVVRGTAIAGTDIYRVTANVGGALTSNTLSVYVQSAVSPTPVIAAVRGVNNGIPGRLGYVAPDDTGMEVELMPIAGQQWVQIKVYPLNSGTPVYSSGAIDISAVAPKVTVPKASLPAGLSAYQVVAQNGYGASARSAASDTVVNATYTTGIGITQARYDSLTKKLYIYGSGFVGGDTINAGSLNITDASTSQNVNLSGALVTVNGWGQITLDLSSIAAVAANLQDPAKFSGSDVVLTTQTGWLVRSNGQVATADTTGKPVTPGARIDYAVYDRSNSRLYIRGQGFNTGTPDYSKLKLTVGAGGTDFVLSTMSPSRSDDTLLTFTLNATAKQALDTNGAYTVTAADGWFVDSGAARIGATAIPVYAQIALGGVTYAGGKVTITGSGFTGGSVVPGQLSIVDLSTPASLALTGATTNTVNDTTIEITLVDPTAFENASFSGNDIFLQGDPGWFVNAQNRSAAGIPVRALRFPTR